MSVFEHVFVFDEVGIPLAGCTLMFNYLHLGSVCICVWACICICRSGYFSGRLHTDEQWLPMSVYLYLYLYLDMYLYLLKWVFLWQVAH